MTWEQLRVCVFSVLDTEHAFLFWILSMHFFSIMWREREVSGHYIILKHFINSHILACYVIRLCFFSYGLDLRTWNCHILARPENKLQATHKHKRNEQQQPLPNQVSLNYGTMRIHITRFTAIHERNHKVNQQIFRGSSRRAEERPQRLLRRRLRPVTELPPTSMCLGC